MIQMDLFTNRNKHTDLENRLKITKGERVGEGRVGSLRLADTNYYIKQINKVLLYSTGNYVQYLITYNRKE